MFKNRTNILLSAGLILLAAILKVTTYPNSFNPIIAISLFSGAIISDRKLAFIIPLLAMLLSDVMMEVLNIAPGFYGLGQVGNYAALLFVTGLGFFMKKINVLTVAGFSIGASILFFLLSNTNVFIFDNGQTYSRSFTGFVSCLEAGIPFLKNRISIDLLFGTIMFGSYFLLFKYNAKKAIA